MINYRTASQMDEFAILQALYDLVPPFAGHDRVLMKARDVIHDFHQGMDGDWGPVCEDDFKDQMKPIVKKIVKATGKSSNEVLGYFELFFDGAIWDDN